MGGAIALGALKCIEVFVQLSVHVVVMPMVAFALVPVAPSDAVRRNHCPTVNVFHRDTLTKQRIPFWLVVVIPQRGCHGAVSRVRERLAYLLPDVAGTDTRDILLNDDMPCHDDSFLVC